MLNDKCWISVFDRLPKKDEYDWVLVRVKMVPEDYYGVPHIAELRNGVWFAFGIDKPFEQECSVKVTDWQPLPEEEQRKSYKLGVAKNDAKRTYVVVSKYALYDTLKALQNTYNQYFTLDVVISKEDDNFMLVITEIAKPQTPVTVNTVCGGVSL